MGTRKPPSLDLCEDEGCPHFGKPHVCVTADKIKSTEFPRLKKIENDPDFNIGRQSIPPDAR